MEPIPRYATWEKFNAHLLIQCQKRCEHKLRRHQQTIGERFEKDKEMLLPLPAAPSRAWDKRRLGDIDGTGTISRENYSVPVEWYPCIWGLQSHFKAPLFRIVGSYSCH
jgi:hypothetical protein